MPVYPFPAPVQEGPAPRLPPPPAPEPEPPWQAWCAGELVAAATSAEDARRLLEDVTFGGGEVVVWHRLKDDAWEPAWRVVAVAKALPGGGRHLVWM